MSSTQSNLSQISGSFNSASMQVLKALYCLPGATAATNSQVYEISTFVDGQLDLANFPTSYTNATGNPVVLTPAQILTLKPGGCADNDYEFTFSMVCAAGVTLELRALTTNGQPTGASVFYNPATNTAVATPAVFTYGACTILKTPSANQARNTAVINTTTAVQTIPAGGAFRQLVVHNRSNVDIIISGTTVGGAGAGIFSQIVSRQGSEVVIALSINPDEGVIATVSATSVATAPFSGVAPVGTVIFNYKN